MQADSSNGAVTPVPGLLEVRMLSSWGERLRGLLGKGADEGPVILVGCRSVHTFGMCQALDLAFVGRDGLVLKVRRGVAPRRLVSCLGARHVMERVASQDPWPCVGDRTRFWIGFEQGSAREGARHGSGH